MRKSPLVTKARVGDEAEDLKSSRYCANAMLGAGVRKIQLNYVDFTLE